MFDRQALPCFVWSLFLFLSLGGVRAAEEGAKPVFATPVGGAGAMTPAVPLAAEGRGFGFFFGVNTFEDADLSPLRFAVNDAIAMAHFFVVEAGLIPPAACHLLLAGDPSNARATAQLAALRASGVAEPLPATRRQFFTSLTEVAKAANRPSDFLLLFFSTHGFSEGNQQAAYIMPTNGTHHFLSDEAINLTSIRDRLGSLAKAQKWLFFIDACRSRPLQSKGTDGAPEIGRMSAAFQQAFGAAEGRVSLFSCDIGQVSFEDAEKEQGIFSYYALEGLRGAAGRNTSGYVTVGTLIDYVSEEVRGWVEQKPWKGEENLAQRPFFVGSNAGRGIPLAQACAEQLPTIAADRVAGLELARQAFVAHADRLGPERFAAIQKALERAQADPCDYAASPLAQLTGKLRDHFSAEPVPPGLVDSFVTWWEREWKDTGPGRLVLNSRPAPAEVMLGEQRLGTTPLAVELPAGTHALVLRHPDFADTPAEVRIAPGETLEAGTITLQAAAGAPPTMRVSSQYKGKVGETVEFIFLTDRSTEDVFARNLPPGLQVDPKKSQIVGTPLKEGTFTAELIALNTHGRTSESFQIEIEASVATSPPTTRARLPIVNDLYDSFAPGERISIQILAENAPTSYDAADLPRGLSVNPRSGVISGAVERPGSYTIRLFAINEAGRGSGELELEIADDTTPENTGVVYTMVYSNNYFTAGANGAVINALGMNVGQMAPSPDPRAAYSLTWFVDGSVSWLGIDGVIYNVYNPAYPTPVGTWSQSTGQ